MYPSISNPYWTNYTYDMYTCIFTVLVYWNINKYKTMINYPIDLINLSNTAWFY